MLKIPRLILKESSEIKINFKKIYTCTDQSKGLEHQRQWGNSKRVQFNSDYSDFPPTHIIMADGNIHEFRLIAL